MDCGTQKDNIEEREREQRERTEMQVVVPIEDTSSGDVKIDHCLDQEQHCALNDGIEGTTIVNTRAQNNKDNNYGAILSDDLRDQFETMKSVWRQARRGAASGNDDATSSASSCNGDGTETKETRALFREGLKRKERETAFETAIKVENEISKWQHGIADLEALLAAEEEYSTENGDVEDNGPPTVREIAFVTNVNNNSNSQQPLAIPSEDECDKEEDNAWASTSSSDIDNATSGR